MIASFRHLVFAAIALCEYLLIAFCYDSAALRNDPEFGWLARAGFLAPLGLVTAAALWVLYGGRPRRDLTAAIGRGSTRSWLLTHVVGFCAFFACTQRIFGTPGSAPTVGWVVAWGVTGLASLMSLAIAAVGLRALGKASNELCFLTLAGAVVGGVAWTAGLMSAHLWWPLGRLTVELTHLVLRATTSDVVYDAPRSIVGTAQFNVSIAPLCSGYESIGVVSAFVVAHLWTARREFVFPRALVVLPLALLAAYAANVARIVSLIALGSSWSRDVALGGFHSKAGWVLVCGVCAALPVVTRRFRWIARGDAPAESGADDDDAAAYLLPALSLLAVHMVTALFAARFDVLYVLGPLAAAAVLLAVRSSLPLARWSPTWHAPAAGAAVFVMWLALEPVSPKATVATNALRAFVANLGTPWAALWVAGKVVGSTVVVPVVEELAFRGYVLRRCVARDFSSVPFDRFTWSSFVISSVGFGFLHDRWIAGILAGMTFAAIQYRRGRLGDAIVAHAFANGLIAAAVLAAGWWSLWT